MLIDSDESDGDDEDDEGEEGGSKKKMQGAKKNKGKKDKKGRKATSEDESDDDETIGEAIKKPKGPAVDAKAPMSTPKRAPAGEVKGSKGASAEPKSAGGKTPTSKPDSVKVVRYLFLIYKKNDCYMYDMYSTTPVLKKDTAEIGRRGFVEVHGCRSTSQIREAKGSAKLLLHFYWF